jgi:CRISPR/Cas system-associated endonuclease Cas1
MRSLYVSQQGCYVSLDGETLIVKQNGRTYARTLDVE